ncbi:MAG: hypothetical protein AB7I30_07955 [Isosphaeraceae bacterium]
MTDTLTPWELEVHVKKFMLDHRRRLGISDDDAHWLRVWLETARKLEEKPPG